MPTIAAFSSPESPARPLTGSLVAKTPPAVTMALSRNYALIEALDKLMALITWTDSEASSSFLMVLVYVLFVNYFEIVMLYVGHIIVASGLIAFYLVHAKTKQANSEPPTLDSIVRKLDSLSTRYRIFLMPLSSLSLKSRDLTRLAFTSLFMTPVYVLVTVTLLTPRRIALLAGVYVLSFHSNWARVLRGIFWRWRPVKLLVFYTTGIDFDRAGRRRVPMPGVKRSSSNASLDSQASIESGGSMERAVRFTYVIFENQRRWLGIGWTSNLLAYERTPFTDECLNECSSPEKFVLPDSDGSGMSWRWVDKEWRVDLTNGGSLKCRLKAKLSPDPGEDDGFVYYDSVWKHPSAVFSFFKYTRRRRWVRTAELVGYEDADKVRSRSTSASAGPDTPNSQLSTPATEVVEQNGEVEREPELLGDAETKDGLRRRKVQPSEESNT